MLQTDELSSTRTRWQSDQRELASLEEQLEKTKSLFQETISQKQQEHEESLSRIEKLNQEVERANATNLQQERKLQEASLKEQIIADSHRREIQIILERLEMSEKQKADISINYNALTSSVEAKEQQLLESIKLLQATLESSQNELVLLKTQHEQSQAKLKEQEALSLAIRCQLESDYTIKVGCLEEQVHKLSTECNTLRRRADDADSMVELLRSSLKSRQEQHEQCIEELARTQSELAQTRESPDQTIDFEALDRELSTYKQRISELESKLAMSPRDTKNEMKLRIELERVRETASKDRKIALLRIADLEEQVNELTSAKTSMIESAEKRIKQAEFERDTETDKVKKLQDAIKQLTSDRLKAESVAKKENQTSNNHGNSGAGSNARNGGNTGQQTNECLQQ